MPHCILEYSNNLPVEINFHKLFEDLHELLIADGHFKIEHIKSRAISYDQYYIGNGDKEKVFIAFTLKLLSGRDDQTKKMFSDEILIFLKEQFSKVIETKKINISVNIVDLQRETYTKFDTGEF